MALHDDRPREFCGIVGIYGSPEAAVWTYLGFICPAAPWPGKFRIASSDGQQIYKHLGMGLVADVFNERILKDFLVI